MAQPPYAGRPPGFSSSTPTIGCCCSARLDPAGGTWWFTPGGGVHRGETLTAAAVRELAEETGYASAEAGLGPVVATSLALWKGDHDRTLFLGAHSFFFLRVPQPVIDTDGQEDFERVVITGHRWWTLDELQADHGRQSSRRPWPTWSTGSLRDDIPSRPAPSHAWVEGG